MASTSLGRLYVDLLMKTGSFETDAGRAAKIAEKRAREIDKAFAGAMSNVKSHIIGTGVALLGVSSIASLSQKAFDSLGASIDYADRLDELSARLGISTEKLSAWGYAGKMTGIDLDKISDAIPKLSKNIAAAADSSSSAGKLFAALGVSVTDAGGKLRDVEDVLPEISDRFKALTNDTEKQALAQELFGKSGADMLEFLSLGADGLQAMGDRAAALGIVLGSDVTGRAAALNDRLEDLHAVTQGISTQIASGMLPNLTEATVRLTEMAQKGELAANATTLLNTGVDLGVGLMDGYNKAVSRVQLTIEVLAGSVRGLYEAQHSLLTFDFEGYAKAWAGIGASFNGAQSRLDELRAAESMKPTLAPIIFTGELSPDALQLDAKNKALQAQIDAYMKRAGALGVTGTHTPRAGASSGLTDDQRKAQETQRAYESLNATMAERAAMLREEIATGEKVGEAWKVAYDIQNGGLQKLAPTEKLHALVAAEQLDILQHQIDLKEIADKKGKQANDVIADLQAEFEALGLSNEALRLRNELNKAGVKLEDEKGQQIAKTVHELFSESRMIEGLDSARGIAYDLLVDLPKNGADAWKNALDQIEQRLLQWAASGIVDQLFGEQGTNGKGSAAGGWLNTLGSIFASKGVSGGTGGGFSSIISSIFGGGRADGGPVMGGKFYEVTERGLPELVTIRNKQLLMMPPNVSGHVTPLHAGGGGGGAPAIGNLNFYLAAPTDHRTQSQIASRTAFELQRSRQRNG